MVRKIDNTNLANPSFDASLEADGYAEAHLMPTLVFGIKFNKVYGIDDAGASLVADGWARLGVHSDLVGGECVFGYRVSSLQPPMSLMYLGGIPNRLNLARSV